MRSFNPWPFFPIDLEPPAVRSLSLQFLLRETLNYFSVLDELEIEAPQILKGEHLEQEIVQIEKKLEKILAFSLENPFTPKGGALDQLCFYFEVLIQVTKLEMGSEVTLLLEEMRTAVLKKKNKLIFLKKNPKPGLHSQILSSLSTLFKDLKEQLSRFFSLMVPFLEEAKEDEKVLFYLVEQKDLLNLYLGNGRVETILADFFPKGIESLRAYLKEAYEQRGFLDFFKENEFLLNSLGAPFATEGPSACMNKH